jgi:hypothetical protein
MKYFNSLPLITTTDTNGNSYLLRNLLVRTELIPQLAKNPLVLYQYEVRDGDTPEIIANKYYGDSYRYWMVLYGNPNIIDPQGDWPKSSQQFVLYLNDKYADEANTSGQSVLAYTQSTIHHYEKIITTVDNNSQTTAIKNVWVDLNTYNSIVPSTSVNTFADGSSVTLSVTSNAISIYDYENGLNESKRNINLINSNYISQMESQYQSLVSQ